jgi:hypothetical protein
MRRWANGTGQDVWAAFNFSEDAATLQLPVPAGNWIKLLDSVEPRWQTSSEFLAEPVVAAAGGPSARPALFDRPRQPQPAPARLTHAGGSVQVTVAPWSFALYGSEQGA